MPHMGTAFKIIKMYKCCEGFGRFVDSKLNFKLHYEPVMLKAREMLGFINRVTPYYTTLKSTYLIHPKCKVHLSMIIVWSLYCKVHINKLKSVQKSFV
ncbi:hypothetical protein O3G_MSEX004536 [Manduca sexta]|uniref:Uncharacterized protein n=1 Tax=Manduca sexta TaxID=7130 RepID=A0A921YVL2_MANSE|nr:hypothetical protein O3G_MSEX004536 [Manduca sexta]